MDTRKFLEAVLAWDVEGFCSLHWHKPGETFRGRACTTLDELLKILETLCSVQSNVYFALARHSGKRTRECAIAFRAVWLDIDVDEEGKDENKYHSLAEAIAAVFCFCRALSIPHPSFMVGSGGGLHAYWASDRSLALEEWQQYAEALKTIARKWGLKCDGSVIADAARVLRPPGTHNFKFNPPRPVRVLRLHSPSHPYDFAAVFTFAGAGFGSVGVNVSPGPIFTATACKIENVPQENFSKPHPLFDLPFEDLGEGIEGLPPLPFEPIMAGCEWLRTAYETGGKEYNQEQWMFTTLCAVWLENGQQLAHKMASGYPKYSYHETEDLWQRKNREHRIKNLGWVRCSTIADKGSRFCQSCQHFQQHSEEGKSPLHLGIAEARARQAGVEETEPAQSLHLPQGYALNKEGFICKLVPKAANVAGQKVSTGLALAQVLLTKIVNPFPHHNGVGHGLEFTAIIDDKNKTQVRLAPGQLHGQALLAALGENSVLFDYKNRGYLMELGPTWTAKLRAIKESQESPTLGWHYHEGIRVGFCHGSKVFGCDGKEGESRIQLDDNLYRWYMPAGKSEPWFRAAKLLTDRKQPELDLIMSVPFAAPLVPFLGNFYGGMVSVWGHPGTAKSTAQQVAAAVWGHPKQTRESLDSTKKSVTNRLGRTKNLPAYWDDVQDEIKQEHLFHTMFMGSQGIEGSRLTSDVQARERGEWQTLMVACSNASFVEYVIKKQPSTTAGLRRVLEIEFKKPENEVGMIDELDAMQAFGELEHNYGHVGMQYAKLLAAEHDRIKALVDETTKRFKSTVEGKADEAYWWGTASILIVGAQLAQQLGAEMGVLAMEGFLVDAFEKNRVIRADEGTEGGSSKNTEEALALFLNFYLNGHSSYTDIVWLDKSRPVNPIHNPLPGRPVYIHVIRDQRSVRISKKAFRDFLTGKNIKTTQVFEGLKHFYRAQEKKCVLAGGTAFAGAAEPVFEIPIMTNTPLGASLEQLLNAHGETQCDDWQGEL